MANIGNSRVLILLAETCLSQPNSDTIQTAVNAMEVVKKNYQAALLLLSLIHSEELWQ